MAVFEGLTQVHFDAYTEEKWSSMVHNLTRMKAKDTLSKLVKALVDGHRHHGRDDYSQGAHSDRTVQHRLHGAD